MVAPDSSGQIVPEPGLVVLMCGLAGSGKTTFAQALERSGFTRLSIDEAIWERFGRFGVDYLEGQYAEHQAAALEAIEVELRRLVAAQTAVVLDMAFWNRGERQRFRSLIADAGGVPRIVYLRATPEVLRTRLRERSTRFDANAAFPITEAILERYLRDFEEPSNEGELVIDIE